ncbi:hypothetical protein Glove_216g114 [Diversispora epigaea]|uniref:F-box domain-containing protein n=1 Tax=Diversispora epigaea TaxID=1348612 RepID=A0A397IHK9_9GLOM|nr:hypothetical protein Glove_216g114 [Diversispora epigaea]
MASKLPPECLQEIFGFLKNKKKNFHLFSCLLVNRYWCSNAASVLWRNPAQYPKSLIRTYIKGLPTESKIILKDKEINLHETELDVTTFLNYASFIRILNLNEFFDKVSYIVYDDIPYKNKSVCYLLYFELCKHLVKQSSNIDYQYKAVSLGYPPLSTKIINFIPESSHLQSLECDTMNTSEEFSQISKIFSSIEELMISFNNDGKNPALIDLINGLDNLDILKIRGHAYKSSISGSSDIYKALHEKVSSLTCLDIKISGNMPLSWLNGIKQLEEFKLYCMEFIRPEDTKKILEQVADKLFVKELLVLDINVESLVATHLGTILLDVGSSLQEMSLRFSSISDPENLDLLEEHITRCSNLLKFKISATSQFIQHLPQILKSLNNLKELFILPSSSHDVSEWMLQLGQSITPSLRKIVFDCGSEHQNGFDFSIESLSDFLNACEENSVKNLLFVIKRRNEEISKTTFDELLRKFVNSGTLNENFKVIFR